MPDKPIPPANPKPPANEPPPPIIDAGRLFGLAKEVQIDLQGVRYRLRITRRGKLILQK